MSNNTNKFLKEMDCVEKEAEKETPKIKKFDCKLRTKNLNRNTINGNGRCKFI